MGAVARLVRRSGENDTAGKMGLLVLEIGLTILAVVALFLVTRAVARAAVREEYPADLTLDDARGLLAQGKIDVEEFERLKAIILRRQRERAGLEKAEGPEPCVRAQEEDDARKDCDSDVHPASPDS